MAGHYYLNTNSHKRSNDGLKISPTGRNYSTLANKTRLKCRLTQAKYTNMNIELSLQRTVAKNSNKFKIDKTNQLTHRVVIPVGG